MSTPLRQSLYLTACVFLGGFAPTLAVAAITFSAGLDSAARHPLEIVAAVLGCFASAALAARHLARRNKENA